MNNNFHAMAAENERRRRQATRTGATEPLLGLPMHRSMLFLYGLQSPSFRHGRMVVYTDGYGHADEESIDRHRKEFTWGPMALTGLDLEAGALSCGFHGSGFIVHGLGDPEKYAERREEAEKRFPSSDEVLARNWADGEELREFVAHHLHSSGTKLVAALPMRTLVIEAAEKHEDDTAPTWLLHLYVDPRYFRGLGMKPRHKLTPADLSDTVRHRTTVALAGSKHGVRIGNERTVLGVNVGVPVEAYVADAAFEEEIVHAMEKSRERFREILESKTEPVGSAKAEKAHGLERSERQTQEVK